MARSYKRDRKGRFARVNSLSSAARLRAGQVSYTAKDRSAKLKRLAQADVKVRDRILKPASVPYARVSPHSATAGWNGGVNASKKYRVQAGFYVRVERRGKTKIQKQIEAKDNAFIGAIVNKITKDEKLQPYVEQGVRKARMKIVNKAIGGQYNLPGGKASGRLTTSMGGLPSVTVRKGQSRVSKKDRGRAIADYNTRMNQVLKGRQVKKPRPQRRNVAGRAA